MRLRDVLQSWLVGPIEHIGSTAVPGLAAKPVVDIMAGVELWMRQGRRSRRSSAPAIATLRTAPTRNTGSASPPRNSARITCT